MMKTEDILRLRAEHEMMLDVFGTILMEFAFPRSEPSLLVKTSIKQKNMISQFVRERTQQGKYEHR